MKQDSRIILEQIVNRKSRELCLEKQKWDTSASIVTIFREEWHVFARLLHPLVSILEIQSSFYVEEEYIRAVWYPHPVMMTADTRREFILFANEANIELYSGGRFWCDENMDFAYEIVLPAEMAERCEREAARQLFDIPYSNFCDLHLPLVMLKRGSWKADTAKRYLAELRESGYVDNTKYDLW
ncbi:MULTISPECIES: hypothetical protein [Mediterraneibacter]|uniref:hypothetical protein n=1 Tax=Mediterraneibacter TaxID=2316020 RepID=UPI000E47BD49|nr:hypothetical protein [Mediterraneibacter massiliensis]RGT75239.1 hypothetical protein DWX08_01980 [Ruminococcus sp. AF18-22]